MNKPERQTLNGGESIFEYAPVPSIPTLGSDTVKTPEITRVFVCGTRATVKIERAVAIYRVVCATCGSGGTVRHSSNESANKAAVRDSGRPCRKCGAA